MSMIHSHPVLDPNAQAKAMIDAVTGHQPSPLDSEYSSKHQQHLNRKPARKTSNLVGTKTSSYSRKQPSSRRFRAGLVASCKRARRPSGLRGWTSGFSAGSDVAVWSRLFAF